MATKRNKLSDVQMVEIVRLYTEESKSYAELATMYTVSMGTIANVLRKAGAPTRGRGRPKGSKNAVPFTAVTTVQNDDGTVSVQF